MSRFDDFTIQLGIYVVFGVIVVLFTIAINFLLLKFLKNIHRGGLAQNGQNGSANLVRWASQTKPAIGGISFFILFLLSVCAYFVLPFGNAEFYNKSILALVGSSTLGFLVGLVDDSFNTPPRFKFLGQLGCTIIIVAMGIYIPISGYWLIDVLFTTVWVVGIMNSINMLDNMDGITASVSTAVLLTALMIVYLNGTFASFYAIVLVGVIAALIGFLFFNWHPAKMYMGDSGSQFLGAFLACISIVLMWQFRGEGMGRLSVQQFLVPAIAFLLPIIDTTTVCIRRIKRGQSPFVGGRDHTTHHLAYCGLNDRQVALVFVMLSTVSIAINYWIVTSLATWNVLYSLLVIAYCIAVFVGMQLIYEKGKALKQERDLQNATKNRQKTMQSNGYKNGVKLDRK